MRQYSAIWCSIISSDHLFVTAKTLQTSILQKLETFLKFKKSEMSLVHDLAKYTGKSDWGKVYMCDDNY